MTTSKSNKIIKKPENNMSDNKNYATIPSELKKIDRWLIRDKDKKPVQWKNNCFIATKWGDTKNWLSFEKAVEEKIPEGGGLGFIFTNDDDIGGIDLDGCRDPNTEEITSWAKEIIEKFSSYAEISPSGTGIKIYARGAPDKVNPNIIDMSIGFGGKNPQVEVYVTGRYFAVTGNHLSGTPKEIQNTSEAWSWIVEKLKRDSKNRTKKQPIEKMPLIKIDGKVGEGQRNNRATSLAGTMHRRNMTSEAILAALKQENKLMFDPPLPEEELTSVVKSITRKEQGFLLDKNEKILPRSQDNIRLALNLLNIRVSYDTFADRLLIQRGQQVPVHLDDAAIDNLWLEVDSAFGFQPPLSFFRIVVMDAARGASFHPVRNYLDSLIWDGKERLDKWLVEYAGAGDNKYTHAVGSLVLIAAVRRVRQPGCKFDELLVLESPQGTNKSTALATLVPHTSLFTDDLPLNVDSKQVIERTTGRWIVEASELSGMRKGEVEHLKGFLSRQKDVARLAYGRTPTERLRHFIVVGTTNSEAYLKDTTGNRRFWLVRVEGFDLVRLSSDRDQLWVEAAVREADGASIRLDPQLYLAASGEQEKRRVIDPWESMLEEALGDQEGRITSEKVWEFVGVTSDKRTQSDNSRLGEVLRRLGFKRTRISGKGRKLHGYKRGEDKRIIQLSKPSQWFPQNSSLDTPGEEPLTDEKDCPF